ncbi:MAG: acetate--CoA ligase [Alicyclobacillus mali]|uniref:acetate--CoA ligase n=1 Tax=Alicyclobacillus mali (ex Roth et al. 2021) TaxID=1123961 RepID=UPI0023F19DD9|nr:acetate--CoA ligase [Alicyclobacillus mali (ex Roth et al. 2021)]MCL6487551.1 acetate--CoA ligase [Alicyclobacillus mali (ex Roth et al. 2021)]
MADEVLSMIASARLIPPPEAYAARSYLSSYDEYRARYQASIDDPAAFWDEIADELVWQQRGKTVIAGELPDFQFFPGSYINVCENCVDRHAKHPMYRNKVALFFEGEDGERRSVTYLQLQDAVSRFANALKDLGLRQGDVVCVYMQNLIETYVALLACLRIGVLYNTVFAGFSAEALRERIVRCGAKAVICANGSLRRGRVLRLKETVDRALEGVETVEHVIVYRRLPDLDTPMTPGRDLDFESLVEGASRDCPPAVLEANEPAFLIFTSGTTGRPKGIVHAGGGFLLGTYAYTKYQLDLRPEDVYWNTADIGWLTSHIFVLVGGLASGTTTLLYEGALDWPKPGRLYEMIERYRVNKLFSAPTAYRMMMKHGEDVARPYDLSSLELLVSVGEPFNPEAWHWVRRVVGGDVAVINNTWGQTETGGTPLALLPGAVPMKPGSCGVPFFGHDLAVVDEQGREVPDGVPGYLVIRRPFPSLARDVYGDRSLYLNAYFSRMPGLYFTGDSAVRDADGHFWVLGRVDDVINVSGHRISTMEMESSLIQHPAVVEAAVVGEPDDLKGQVPVAFVTLERGWEPKSDLEEELKARVVADIGSFARPARVYFVEAMPKTRSGKILRRMLREILQTGEVKGDVTGLEDWEIVERLLHDLRERAPGGE